LRVGYRFFGVGGGRGYGKEGRHHKRALSNGLELVIRWGTVCTSTALAMSKGFFQKELLLHTTQIQTKDPNFSGMQ